MKRYSHTLFFVAFATFGLLTSGLAQAQQPTKPQRADTLRRELTVVSDAEVHLGTVLPLASTYQFDKPKVTRLEPIPPRSTGDFTPPVLLPEYPALSNMASWVPRSNKAGYLDLSLGLEPVVLKSVIHNASKRSTLWICTCVTTLPSTIILVSIKESLQGFTPIAILQTGT